MDISIRRMNPGDYPQVQSIYLQGIDTGMTTFETQVPDRETFFTKFPEPGRWVAVLGNEVVGWAAWTAVSVRHCYRGVAEVTVYVENDHKGKSIGSRLLQELILRSEEQGYWSLLAVIHEENKTSINLHASCGFRTIGYRERIAQVNGVWKNTVMMERRSRVTGN